MKTTDPNFDREAYWLNRKAGLRGQGASEKQLIRVYQQAQREALAKGMPDKKEKKK